MAKTTEKLVAKVIHEMIENAIAEERANAVHIAEVFGAEEKMICALKRGKV